MLFDYGYKVTTFFLIYKFFLTFFLCFFSLSAIIHIYSGFSAVPVFRWCVPVVSCVRWSPDNHTHAHTYAHTHTRTGIFR